MGKGCSVLFADDDEIIREQFTYYLKRMGCHVFEAKDGEAALNIWHEKQPDIVLLDIDMPKRNGVDVLKQVRHDSSEVPVIMMTGHSDKEHLLAIVELNVQRFLEKPVMMEEFDQALKECIRKLAPNSNEFALDGIYTLDYDNNCMLHEKGEPIMLTRQEKRFMKLLLDYQHRIVTYNEIEHYVWQDKFMTEYALKALLRNLRKKFPKNYFKNYRGEGFKLEI